MIRSPGRRVVEQYGHVGHSLVVGSLFFKTQIPQLGTLRVVLKAFCFCGSHMQVVAEHWLKKAISAIYVLRHFYSV